MIKEAIEKILGLAPPNMIEHAGRKYSDKQLQGIKPPSPDVLHMKTLDGICDWLCSMDDLAEKCMIHVAGYLQVSVIGALKEPWNDRNEYVSCCPPSYNGFSFSHYMDIEEFIINVQSKFVNTPTKKKLIDYVSKVRGELVTASNDDGIAQEVTMEDKIGRLAQVQIDPIVKLRPYRTFPEVEQPESPFLLRMISHKGELPSIALHEVDGGMWKVQAMKNIADYLNKKSIIKAKEIDIIC